MVLAVAVPETAGAIDFFRWLRENPLKTPSMAVLPDRPDDSILRATLEVADDFLFHPVRELELKQRLTRVLGRESGKTKSVRPKLMEELGKHQLVGQDEAFLKIVNTLPRIADSEAYVLMTGETGTGKELFARAIHHLSRRHNFPFIPVDCGAIPETLFENELFGHAPGAYTDARASQKGLVAMAQGGTLFLDEVDSLSPSAQAKLLRFLQEKTYKRLGEEKFRKADVNIIAATNKDLLEYVRNGQFRSDLYYRLNVLQVHLPLLRDRGQDISLLAMHYLNLLNQPKNRKPKTFSPAALSKLAVYDWPGNVRELFNLAQRAVMLAETAQIWPRHILFLESAPAFVEANESFCEARRHVIATFEKQYVEELLRKHRGNVTKAAREAQKERRTFGRLVKKYNIDRQAV